MRTKVLIVEDDRILRGAYKTKLGMEGFDVRAAEDGAVALEMARAERPDVILLDLNMPRMTGTEFLEAYDVLEENSGVVVIVFSNMSVPGLAERSMELGAKRFLLKSTVTPNRMVEIVREAVAGEDGGGG